VLATKPVKKVVIGWVSRQIFCLKQVKQGQRKAWHIPSPKNLTQRP
jgi:hypothetical protein